jgi:large conductance mechanosensitive channel
LDQQQLFSAPSGQSLLTVILKHGINLKQALFHNRFKEAHTMVKEFRDFIFRGNVIDLAVAVIMAAAFGAIIASLVNDIIMPIIGVILGGLDFSALAIQYGTAVIAYGKCLQAIVTFVIIAFVLFLIVRSYNRFLKKKEEAPAAPPAPSAEEKLLTEIRDLLKERK